MKGLKHFHDFFVSNKFLFMPFIAPLQNNFLVNNFQKGFEWR